MDRRLYLPEEGFDEVHAPLRKRYGVPEDLVFTTEPQLGLGIVQRLRERQTILFLWILADET